jgi:hypothetical protein
MKLSGNLALGSSSARKYLSTCDVCFQKFRVSCFMVRFGSCDARPSAHSVALHGDTSQLQRASVMAVSYLKLLVAGEEQDVHGPHLVHVSMPLEFLAYLCP